MAVMLNTTSTVSNLKDLNQLNLVAHVANRLSHSLTGRSRDLALALKDLACSLAILEGAVVNGQRTGDLIGLSFSSGATRKRVHARLSRLHPEARGIARRQATSAPAVAPLSDSRGADQLVRLRNLLPTTWGVHEIGLIAERPAVSRS
jgi:hypothetical protein